MAQQLSSYNPRLMRMIRFGRTNVSVPAVSWDLGTRVVRT